MVLLEPRPWAKGSYTSPTSVCIISFTSMPVMVVWGTDDPVLPVTQADSLPAHFHIHHVLDAGHMLVEEAPGVIAQALRRNMARRGRRARPTLGAAAS